MAAVAGVTLAVTVSLLGPAPTARVSAAAAATAATATTWAPPPARYAEGAALDLPVVAADGTVLRADAYFPVPLCAAGGKAGPGSAGTCPARPATFAGGFPVLLQQTPYGKQDVVQGGSSFATDVPSLVGQGYVVVVADVRGTGRSGGVWGLFDPVQATDGAVLARWAADELPRFGANGAGIESAVPGLAVNGEVGLFGASYMGINQFLTVKALDGDGGPNPVRVMFPMITGNDLYRDVVTEGGLVNIEFSAAYLALLDGLGTADPVLDPIEQQSFDASQGGAQPVKLLQELAGFPVLAAGHARQVTQFDAPTVLNVETGGPAAYDAGEGLGSNGYWPVRNPINAIEDVVHDGIAAFLVGGWHDLFQRGELLNYTGLQNAWFDKATGASRPLTAPMAPGQPATARYQLLMGPWTHLTAGAGSDLAPLEIEWFDSWLRGPAFEGATPVTRTRTPLHLYALGSGEWNAKQHTGAWLDAADWPLPAADGAGYAGTKLFLGPGSGVGGGGGSGVSGGGGNGGGSGGVSGGSSGGGSGGSLATAAPSRSGTDTLLFTGISSPCSLNTDQWGGGALSEGEANAGATFAWPCDRNDGTFGTGLGARSYTTSPLPRAEMVAGPLDVTLFATSTRPETELVADLEEVSPTGQSVPLTTGALLGSMRALDSARSWTAEDGAPLTPFHPFTAESRRTLSPGQLTRFDIEVFPTVALVPAGWRIRITLSTADTPHVLPTVSQTPDLVGGVYGINHGGKAASFVNLPLVPVSALPTRCSASVCM